MPRLAKLSKVKEADGVPAATRMIQDLVADQAILVASAKDAFAASDAANDQATADLATRRMQIHEKNAWMLRSHLE